MKQLKVRIKLEAPVIISLASGDSTMTQTLSYIPGSTVLGLLANLYIRQHGLYGFNRLFMMGGLRFLNLYPFVNGEACIPCPQNLWKSKRIEKAGESSLHNVFRIKTNLELKKNSSFVWRRVFSAGKTELHEPQKQLAFHHERNYQKGISEESVVFTYEALAPGNEFCGYIVGAEEDLKLVKALLDNQSHLRLGKSKTAQYGRCDLVESEIEELPEAKDAGNYLLLCSDAIFYNEEGTSCADKELLAKILGVKIEDAYTESGRHETAVSILKAKRPSEYTIKAGSIFKLEKLPENHQNIQRYGIGERRWEGFGEVMFVEAGRDHYHIDVPERAAVNKPEGKIPTLIQNICSSTLQRLHISRLKEEAFNAAENINTKPLTKSLVARLDSFVKTGNFAGSLEQLRKTSTDKLRKAYDKDSKDLLTILKDIDNKIEGIIGETYGLMLSENKRLANLKTEFCLDDVSLNQARSIYLHTFFPALRRKIGQEKKAAGGKQ